MVRLGDRALGRDNNLNLIRMVAATAVLVSHAWPITLGRDTVEPLNAVLGHSLGRVSVYIFFIISGFLITASFERSRSLLRFILARVLRLMPGLVVSLLLVTFVMGAAVTTLPLGAYLADPDTWRYVIDGTLLFSPQYTLPGVFETNPFPTVNGSIWTLFYEAACYGLVFALGVLGLLGRHRLAIFVLVYCAICVGVLATGVELPYKLYRLILLSLPFVVGMAAWAWRDQIPLNLPIALALVLAAWLTHGTSYFHVAFMLALAYATFWLAYVPGGIIRRYNELGDYSYGMYIYAFPIQGLVAMYVGGSSIWLHVAIALPLSLLAGVLSWRLVEAPCMGFLRSDAIKRFENLLPGPIDAVNRRARTA